MKLLGVALAALVLTSCGSSPKPNPTPATLHHTACSQQWMQARLNKDAISLYACTGGDLKRAIKEGAANDGISVIAEVQQTLDDPNNMEIQSATYLGTAKLPAVYRKGNLWTADIYEVQTPEGKVLVAIELLPDGMVGGFDVQPTA